MNLSSSSNDRTWMVVGLLWLASLSTLILRSFFPDNGILTGSLGEALWPLVGLSVLLFFTTLRALFASAEDTILAHYAALDVMKHVQRNGVTAFLLLPLAGALSLSLFYPVMMQSPKTPLLAGSQSIGILAIVSLFLWDTYRWQRALSLLGLGLVSLWLPSLWGTSTFPSLSGAWGAQLARHTVMAVFLLLLVGLSLRWMLARKRYRRSLQQGAILLMGCVWLGHLGAWLSPTPASYKHGVSLSLFGLGLVAWTWLGARSLRDIARLHGYPHALAKLHYRPYTLGATLPLALLLALSGWTSFSISPTVLLVLISAQLLAFVSFATLHSVHSVTLGGLSPIWALLRPALVFLFLYFPYGAIGLTVMEMWRR